MSSIYNAFYI